MKLDYYWDNFQFVTEVLIKRGIYAYQTFIVYLMLLGKIKIVPKLQVNEKVRKYFDPLFVWSEVKMCLRSSQDLK